MPRKSLGGYRAVGRRTVASRARGAGKSPTAHVFLVRLWKETREGSDLRPVWRGTVGDLRGNHLGHFGIGAELFDILIDSSDAIARWRNHNRRGPVDA
jgi:hypothetical protein